MYWSAQRTVFSRSLRERAFISRCWRQNANDLGEQAKRSESAGTRCWAAAVICFTPAINNRSINGEIAVARCRILSALFRVCAPIQNVAVVLFRRCDIV
jgi:hypothetical protein